MVYDPERKAFDWSTFRALARLERKTDQSLERYFSSFVNMCRTACRLPPRKDEGERETRTRTHAHAHTHTHSHTHTHTLYCASLLTVTMFLVQA